MKIKDVIKVHMDRINQIEKSNSKKNFNNNRFKLGVLCLGISLVLGYLYSLLIIFIGLGLYAYFSYTAIKW